MNRLNPDQIDSKLWQNDSHRDVTEWRKGPSGSGCLDSLFNLILAAIMFPIAIIILVHALTP